MRITGFALLVLVCICLAGVPRPLFSQQQEPANDRVENAGQPDGEFNETEFGTAVALSQTVTSTTGVAMSPLLGMGALGAWQYFRTDESQREFLPWYTEPWVWGTLFWRVFAHSVEGHRWGLDS